MQVLACQNINMGQRLVSSSGGVFFLLAKEMINLGGCVFGAAFDKDFNVVHKKIENVEELCELQGSKYSLSNIGDSFHECKRELEKGRIVLFSGTPCQIAGLKTFLRIDYDNLFLVDLICHGTPDPMIWKQYLKEISNGKKIRHVSFRDKREGWMDYHFTVGFEDGTEYSVRHDDDLYMKGFLENLTLLEGCFKCRFKGFTNKQSDITLGDLWGADVIVPGMFDNIGTSFVVANSVKGEKIVEKVSSELTTCNICLEDAIKENLEAIVSPQPSIYRNLFKKMVARGNVVLALKRIYKPSFFYRCLNKIYRVVEKTKHGK